MPKFLLLKQQEKKTEAVTGQPRFSWKTVIKMDVAMQTSDAG